MKKKKKSVKITHITQKAFNEMLKNPNEKLEDWIIRKTTEKQNNNAKLEN